MLSTLLLFTLATSQLAISQVNAQQPRGFNSAGNSGVLNPGNRHYFRGETPWYNQVTLRMNGELLGNDSYSAAEWQAYLDTLQTCRINGAEVPPNGWRATCVKEILAYAVGTAVEAVDEDSPVNVANMRTAYAWNGNEATYVTADAGQGQSCDTNTRPSVGTCAGLSGAGPYLQRGQIDFNMDTSLPGKRKIKVTCKKACGLAGGIGVDPMRTLIKDVLFPTMRRNGAMAANFNFHRSDDGGKIFARCRLTIAGEEWYDKVNGCPDVVEGSSERVGQW